MYLDLPIACDLAVADTSLLSNADLKELQDLHNENLHDDDYSEGFDIDAFRPDMMHIMTIEEMTDQFTL